jgi:hypothetical protein
VRLSAHEIAHDVEVLDPGDNQRRFGRPPQLEAVVAELLEAQHAVAGLWSDAGGARSGTTS